MRSFNGVVRDALGVLVASLVLVGGRASFAQLVPVPSWVGDPDIIVPSTIQGFAPPAWLRHFEAGLESSLGKYSVAADTRSGILLVESLVDLDPDPDVSEVDLASAGIQTRFMHITAINRASSQTLVPGHEICMVITGILPDGSHGADVWLYDGVATPGAAQILPLPIVFGGFKATVTGFVGSYFYAFDLSTCSVRRYIDSNNDMLPDALDSSFSYTSQTHFVDRPFCKFVELLAPGVVGFSPVERDQFAKTSSGLGIGSGGVLEWGSFLRPSSGASPVPQASFARTFTAGASEVYVMCRGGSDSDPFAFSIESAATPNGPFSVVSASVSVSERIGFVIVPLTAALEDPVFLRIVGSVGSTTVVSPPLKNLTKKRPVYFRFVSANPSHQLQSGQSFNLRGDDMDLVKSVEFVGSKVPGSGVSLTFTIVSKTKQLLELKAPSVLPAGTTMKGYLRIKYGQGATSGALGLIPVWFVN